MCIRDRARTGITDEGKIQSMLEDGRYYDDEPIDYSNLLLNTYNFGDPDASILKRAPPRPDLYPAIAPSPPSSPTSGRRAVRTISPNKMAAAASSTSTCLLYTSPSPRDRTRSRMPCSG
eukprot:TRINITY_DN45791_c0_g1_i1.p1 TRINITY_DN45791_c0_g1~~TRINITY_DN45791_c0_g1_i1.p1  ORF type:complete len:119 (-),score=8.33 TRINITY_DN45791_c0_g1_i1:45-401(-)